MEQQVDASRDSVLIFLYDRQWNRSLHLEHCQTLLNNTNCYSGACQWEHENHQFRAAASVQQQTRLQM